QVQVYRPVQAPDASGRWSPTFGQALAPMVLSNGQFSFGTVGQLASLVPVGFQSAGNMRGKLLHDLPSDTGTQQWSCYLPPLPDGPSHSLVLREGDRLVDQDGARYVVKHPYRQEAGFVGAQMLIEREVGA